MREEKLGCPASRVDVYDDPAGLVVAEYEGKDAVSQRNHLPTWMKQAQEIVDSYLSRSHVMVLHPTPAHWRTFKEISSESQITHRHVTDAHIAALTMEHEAELCTLDRDFRRFKSLRIIDPVRPEGPHA